MNQAAPDQPGPGPTEDIVLDPATIAALSKRPPRDLAALRVDTNNNCNARCVYCHHHRSGRVMSLSELKTFLQDNVLRVDTLQLGCGMEPTLDPRMADALLLMSRWGRKPGKRFILQTNGTLLHRHAPDKIKEAGLTSLAVSIDSANPETHKRLRGGGSLSGVIVNITNFQRACPDVGVAFVTTVTKANIHEVESVVALGRLLGANFFCMREMTFVPGNTMADPVRMPGLLLARGEFARMKERLLARFGDHTPFWFLDRSRLAEIHSKMMADTLA